MGLFAKELVNILLLFNRNTEKPTLFTMSLNNFPQITKKYESKIEYHIGNDS